jgi:glycerol kinase
MEVTPMTDYILSIDQGTTSTRAIIFDHAGSIVSSGQLEHEQIFPSPAGSNTTQEEIWDNCQVIGQALSKANITRHNITAVGITNQRDRGRVG